MLDAVVSQTPWHQRGMKPSPSCGPRACSCEPPGALGPGAPGRRPSRLPPALAAASAAAWATDDAGLSPTTSGFMPPPRPPGDACAGVRRGFTPSWPVPPSAPCRGFPSRVRTGPPLSRDTACKKAVFRSRGASRGASSDAGDPPSWPLAAPALPPPCCGPRGCSRCCPPPGSRRAACREGASLHSAGRHG